MSPLRAVTTWPEDGTTAEESADAARSFSFEPVAAKIATSTPATTPTAAISSQNVGVRFDRDVDGSGGAGAHIGPTGPGRYGGGALHGGLGS